MHEVKLTHQEVANAHNDALQMWVLDTPTDNCVSTHTEKELS